MGSPTERYRDLIRAVLTAMVGGGTLAGVLARSAEALAGYFDAAFTGIWMLDDGAEALELAASGGRCGHLVAPLGRLPLGEGQIGQVATARSPRLVNVVDHGVTPEDSTWPGGEGVVSFAGFPLLVGDTLIGVVAMFGGRPLDDDVMDVIGSVADSIALGTQQRRTEQKLNEERLAAVTLQRSLLPMSLPEIPGARLASAYQPASYHSQIGGDWYDALAMPGGSYSLTVGDVGGHDLRAAGIMGQLRTVFRMSAIESDGPVDVLTKVDRYHSIFGVAEFATAVQATYDPCTSTLRVASAGHPAPLLIGPDGAVRFLDLDTLPVLGFGLVDETDGLAAETVLVLPGGTQVLFFTDGLIERRDRSVHEGLLRLATAAADFVVAHPEGRNDALLADLLRLPSTKADDVALLLLSIDP